MTALDERPAIDTTRWWEYGACRGADPATFFPHSGEATKIREAKAYCARCPVQPDCRQDGIDGGIYRYGVWGGLTDTDRRRLREADLQPKGEPGAEEARALYAANRSRYASAANAITAIARRLKVPRPTVAGWIGPTAQAEAQRRPATIPDPIRAAALARYHEIRPEQPSDVAAHRIVAAEYGVSKTSVWEWVKQEREAARAAEGP